MAATVIIPIELDAAVASGLSAVAAAEHCSPSALAERILKLWIGQHAPKKAPSRSRPDVAADRYGILLRWWELRRQASAEGRDVETAVVEALAELEVRGRPVCRGTLFNWERRWRSDGLAGLEDGRANRVAITSRAGPFLEELQRLWRAQRGGRFSTCYRQAVAVAEAKGWLIKSYGTARRFVRNNDFENGAGRRVAS